jgi:hypothetical protein
MNPTRRSLCGLGIASVPLAIISPKVFSAAQDPAQDADPLLAYLEEDTKRHCRLLQQPGAQRAIHLRALGANIDVLAAYFHSRMPVARIQEKFVRRLQDEGGGVLAQKALEAWPREAARISRDFGVPLPQDLQPALVDKAIESVARYGCPRMSGVRKCLEAEADRIERWEGRVGLVMPVRQTPGNDYGPPGWAAGIGDFGGQLSCWDLELLMAAIGIIIAFQPETATILGEIGAILAAAYVIACGSRST